MSKVTIPRYTSIAIDIAHSIINDHYQLGEKITGRSTLSSKYSVSPETIRKSIGLLKDMGIVEVNEKSGIIIKSKEQAFLFIEKYSAQVNIQLLHEKILELQKQKSHIQDEINTHLNTIIEYTLKYQGTHNMSSDTPVDSINTIRITLGKDDFVIGKSICDTQFFTHTHGTIVSILRDSERILCPGPSFIFNEGDILNIVCDEMYLVKCKRFIQTGATEA